MVILPLEDQEHCWAVPKWHEVVLDADRTPAQEGHKRALDDHDAREQRDAKMTPQMEASENGNEKVHVKVSRSKSKLVNFTWGEPS